MTTVLILCECVLHWRPARDWLLSRRIMHNHCTDAQLWCKNGDPRDQSIEDKR
jgi:hypothetical protein